MEVNGSRGLYYDLIQRPKEKAHLQVEPEMVWELCMWTG